MNNLCAICQMPMIMVPAGVSKTTGRPYNSFPACQDRTHKQPRAVPIYPQQPVYQVPVQNAPQVNFKPQEAVKTPNWDAISKGKVRHGVALEAIKKDMALDVKTDKWIKNWTNYIMTGELNLDNDLGINVNEIF